MAATTKLDKKIGFVGCGNMATAITEAIVNKGLVSISDLIVSGCQRGHLDAWTKRGTRVTTDNTDIVANCDIIVLAIKPQKLDDALKTVSSDSKTDHKLFISILAGVSIAQLRKRLSSFYGARIVRVMPNMPAMVGEGCSVYTPDETATDEDVAHVESILATFGQYRRVDEHLINPVTALAGGGPAFIFMVIEALADGAVRMGLPRDMATSFAAQTVVGAGRMVLATGRHPAQLKDEVCSPGGTTIAGVHELERVGMRAAFMNAIEKATLRSLELGFK